MSHTSGVPVFKPLKLRIKFHAGHATIHLKSAQNGTIVYELVATLHGATVARSRQVTIFWIPPPKYLYLLSSGQHAEVNLHSGAVTCLPAKTSGGGCLDTAGTGSMGTVQLTATTNTDRMPGTRITITFQGAQVCSSTAFDAQCVVDETAPTVATKTFLTASASYTDLAGKTHTVTTEIPDFP